MTEKLKPTNPGEVPREEFLVPLKMSAGALAKACGLPRTRIERIANEQTGITADTALRLAKTLGTTMTCRSPSTISARFSIASRP